MSVITLKVVVPALADAMAHFNRIKVYRSINGVNGTYAEITDPATRMALESGKTVYEFVDENGDADYYYKSSYFHTVSGLESSLSDAQQGEGDAALDIITVSELKDYFLFGLDLTNDAGEEFTDAMYRHWIKAAVASIETRLDLALTPKDIEEERHDYVREDYNKYIWLKLKKVPVIDVETVKLVLPGEQVVQDFDRDWIHVQKDSGQLQLVPGTGTAGSILLGASGAWIPLIYGQNKFIPDAFRVAYTAGFPAGQVPADLKDIVGKLASFGPLNIAGDLLGGAGIASQSISIDGLSQNFNTTSSATNAGYGARLLQYGKEIKTELPTLRKKYHGIPMAVV